MVEFQSVENGNHEDLNSGILLIVEGNQSLGSSLCKVLTCCAPLTDPLVKIEDMRGELEQSYFSTSSLWKVYKRKFDNQIAQLGWDSNLVDKAIQEASNTPVYLEVLLETVPNSFILKRSEHPKKSLYISHN